MLHSNDVMEKVLQEIADYTSRDIGFGEEDVKIKVARRILECLGYKDTDLSFEHSGIDIFVRGPSKGTCLIVETKKLGEKLERHLPQMKRYMEKTHALLGIMTNGDEFWIFACSGDVPLCKIYRRDLARKENIETLQRLFSKEALSTEEKILTNISEELTKRTEEIEYKLKLTNDMMKAYKSKDLKKLEKLTSEARKAGINLYLDLEEAERLVRIWTKLTEKTAELRKRVQSQI